MYDMKRTLAFLSVAILSVSLSACSTSHEHEWTEATCTEPKTCTICGETEGDPNGHDWEPATCIAPKTCTVCGETEGELSEHNWKAATCTTAKTCTVCGETEGSPSGHKWIAATYENPKTCSVCGKTEGEKLSCSREDFFTGTPAFYLIQPNFAGGIQYLWGDKYIGEKDVKYCTLHYSMENSVGDPAYDEINNQSTYTVKVAGPVTSGHYLMDISNDTPNVYCSMLDTLFLDTIDLEFTDGTSVTVYYGYYVKQQYSNNGFYGILNAIQQNYPDFLN